MRPLHIQWRFNGQPIPGGTNESLEIESVRFADAGDYSVAVSNQFGSAEQPLAEGRRARGGRGARIQEAGRTEIKLLLSLPARG